mmetsp:Transcript_21999/g.62867  ORF Transcript_21999/g.62867 Transcript_21999/m.62867 type:complete len:265 (-) Transcript_21999:723-1517(-)
MSAGGLRSTNRRKATASASPNRQAGRLSTSPSRHAARASSGPNADSRRNPCAASKCPPGTGKCSRMLPTQRTMFRSRHRSSMGHPGSSPTNSRAPIRCSAARWPRSSNYISASSARHPMKSSKPFCASPLFRTTPPVPTPPSSSWPRRPQHACSSSGLSAPSSQCPSGASTSTTAGLRCSPTKLPRTPSVRTHRPSIALIGGPRTSPRVETAACRLGGPLGPSATICVLQPGTRRRPKIRASPARSRRRRPVATAAAIDVWRSP